MKICSTCKKEKPLSYYYARNKKKPKVLCSTCRDCNREKNLRKRKEVKKQIVALMGGCCEICGIIGVPAIYDLHHKDPTIKDFNISEKFYTRIGEKLKTELQKCQLLCANCHRELHYNLLNTTGYQTTQQEELI